MPVSAIIPAYNEENTICAVIDTLKSVDKVDEIIVVNDGSHDNTAQKALECGVTVLSLQKNSGKGAAVKAGLDACKGEVILLLDADLIGLKKKHVEDMLAPVLEGNYDMSIGVFSNGRLSTDLAHMISPYLSGQRVVKRKVLEGISTLAQSGYGIETALTVYAVKNNLSVVKVELLNITHVMKEEKLGLFKGVLQRFKMYWQVYRGTKPAKR